MKQCNKASQVVCLGLNITKNILEWPSSHKLDIVAS